MIRAIKRRIKNSKNKKEQALYHSLFGSIIATIGILKGFNEEENYKQLKLLSKSLKNGTAGNTVSEIFDFVNHNYGEYKEIKNAVLVCDKNDIRTPLVSFYYVDVDGNKVVMPLKPNGELTGILRSVNSENTIVEVI